MQLCDSTAQSHWNHKEHREHKDLQEKYQRLSVFISGWQAFLQWTRYVNTDRKEHRLFNFPCSFLSVFTNSISADYSLAGVGSGTPLLCK